MTPAFSLIMILSAYLLGSISSAVLICKIFQLDDPRLRGSGNPGATNVYRIGGALPALLTLLMDVMKGMLPVWFAYYMGLPPIVLGVVAIAACFGHIYPIFFHFRGGKAVATALGAMFPIATEMALMLIATWIIIFAVSRVSSLAALITVSLAPLYAFLVKPQYTIPAIMLTALIIWRHRTNIIRLWKGEETGFR
ncbi:MULTISPECIES: glycerol-3-phosphate 1-O-acyltransferase PlsY [Gammaproteobacteria]|uniref:glycerol-3-phosphate 1-O-acyltransferase PlsY n=1 Tax=Gammaproteobacteria TaxID=1236 RepID=UPI000DD0CB4A|nr:MULTISPECIES: glycerol-3-phosphate 1-O-acyltransferase PlsY [Gammaproteobacteria]RTE87707.1 glycerol-3-phosphate 1-O-acyltransferase PlsY [Aliidiomarina sp. B3213]TCZ92510.1 glycerol-3-phosphate 1-O-acyltransferase PlsY [Lysobacter sp. N42]